MSEENEVGSKDPLCGEDHEGALLMSTRYYRLCDEKGNIIEDVPKWVKKYIQREENFVRKENEWKSQGVVYTDIDNPSGEWVFGEVGNRKKC